MITLGTYFGALSDNTMYESPFLKRLRMIKQRCRSYPLDTMDFIMIDLERPKAIKRLPRLIWQA